MSRTVPPFQPPRWLRNGHAQTLAAFRFTPRPQLPWLRERLELPDGDFVDLAHRTPAATAGARVCLFHGLEGCLESHYIPGLAAALHAAGLAVTFMHLRGCSGEPNRLPRAYHSGDTSDMAHLFATLQAREPDRPLFAIGFSLSGNALLKYLGETGTQSALTRAAAVSVPFDLARAAAHIDSGFSRVYQHYLLRRLQRSAAARIRLHPDLQRHAVGVRRARSLRAFDDAFTGPLHGFADAGDYYAQASSRPWLPRITTPTLIVHARDDPFVGRAAVPESNEAGPGVRFELSEHGGHVGFIAGPPAQRPWCWLNRRLPDWFRAATADTAGGIAA